MSLHGGQTLAPYASGINVGVQQTSSVLSVQRPRLLGFSVMQSLGPEVQCHGGELRFWGAVMMQSSDREVQHHSAELWSWGAVS